MRTCRTFLTLLLACLTGAALAAAEGANTTPFQTEEAIEATHTMREAVKEAEAEYREALVDARERALKKEETEELMRIDKALAGKKAEPFTSSKAKDAYEDYEKALRRAAKRYAKALSKAAGPAYTGGHADEAKALQETAAQLEAVLDRETEDTKTGKLDAKASRRKTGLELQKGQSVRLQAEGEWRPGGVKGPRGRVHNPKYGDADTYNLAAYVGDRRVGTGGKDWHFTVPADGELALEMAGHQYTRGGAKGSMKLRLTILDPDAFPDLLKTLAPYLEKRAAPTTSRTAADQPAPAANSAGSKGPCTGLSLGEIRRLCVIIDRTRQNPDSFEAVLWSNLSEETRARVREAARGENPKEALQASGKDICNELNALAASHEDAATGIAGLIETKVKQSDEADTQQGSDRWKSGRNARRRKRRW